MKKSEQARQAWEAALGVAKAKAAELETKGDAVTAEDQTALDALITKASEQKTIYDRCVKLEDQEAALATENESAGRKARNTPGAPAILPEGSRNSSSRPLKLSNIWKATMAAGAGANPAVFLKYAGEEFELSNRLKEAGYQTENLGSVLWPLGEDYLIEPIDQEGRKLADFTQLRKEVAERCSFKGDPGEFGWLMKQNAEFARKTFGLEKKDMMLGDDTLGGMLIPSTQSGSIIDLLRARAVLARAGSTEVPLPPSGNLAYPRWTSDASFAQVDPDTTTDMSTSTPGTGVVRLQAKSLRGAVTIPNDLIRYSSPAIETLVRMTMAEKAAIAEDNIFLEQVGSSVGSKGIINYTQSTAETVTANRLTLHVAQTVAANGNTLDPEDVALIQALYEESNDPDPATGWIMRPLFFSKIRNKRADAVSAGDAKGPFMFDLTRSLKDGPVDGIGDVPVFRTTQASRNRSKGSATDLFYVLYGNFRRHLIGRVGAVEISTSEHVKFLQDKTVIRVILRSDNGLAHEESFVFTDTLVA